MFEGMREFLLLLLSPSLPSFVTIEINLPFLNLLALNLPHYPTPLPLHCCYYLQKHHLRTLWFWITSWRMFWGGATWPQSIAWLFPTSPDWSTLPSWPPPATRAVLDWCCRRLHPQRSHQACLARTLPPNPLAFWTQRHQSRNLWCKWPPW